MMFVCLTGDVQNAGYRESQDETQRKKKTRRQREGEEEELEGGEVMKAVEDIIKSKPGNDLNYMVVM